jgi:hypothetical protein
VWAASISWPVKEDQRSFEALRGAVFGDEQHAATIQIDDHGEVVGHG